MVKHPYSYSTSWRKCTNLVLFGNTTLLPSLSAVERTVGCSKLGPEVCSLFGETIGRIPDGH